MIESLFRSGFVHRRMASSQLGIIIHRFVLDYRARRLEVLRVFAQHQAAVEPATAIPPRPVFGPAHRRRAPHIYSPAQVVQLLRRAAKVPGRFRPLTYKTLLGLLACTGRRISEALALEVGAVDFLQGAIFIRASKYHESRWVPLHPTALERS